MLCEKRLENEQDRASILHKHAGREEELYKSLCAQDGVTPELVFALPRPEANDVPRWARLLAQVYALCGKRRSPEELQRLVLRFAHLDRGPELAYQAVCAEENFAPSFEPGDFEVRPVARIRQTLLDLYAVHNPAKVQEVDSLLQKYSGREYSVYLKACDKYKLVPTVLLGDDAEALHELKSIDDGWKARIREQAAAVFPQLAIFAFLYTRIDAATALKLVERYRHYSAPPPP